MTTANITPPVTSPHPGIKSSGNPLPATLHQAPPRLRLDQDTMNFFRAVGIGGVETPLHEGIVASLPEELVERRPRLDAEPTYQDGYEPRGKTAGGVVHVW